MEWLMEKLGFCKIIGYLKDRYCGNCIFFHPYAERCSKSNGSKLTYYMSACEKFQHLGE